MFRLAEAARDHGLVVLDGADPALAGTGGAGASGMLTVVGEGVGTHRPATSSAPTDDVHRVGVTQRTTWFRHGYVMNGRGGLREGANGCLTRHR